MLKGLIDFFNNKIYILARNCVYNYKNGEGEGSVGTQFLNFPRKGYQQFLVTMVISQGSW